MWDGFAVFKKTQPPSAWLAFERTLECPASWTHGKKELTKASLTWMMALSLTRGIFLLLCRPESLDLTYCIEWRMNQVPECSRMRAILTVDVHVTQIYWDSCKNVYWACNMEAGFLWDVACQPQESYECLCECPSSAQSPLFSTTSQARPAAQESVAHQASECHASARIWKVVVLWSKNGSLFF